MIYLPAFFSFKDLYKKMNQQDKEKIINWLKSRRDFAEGVAIYQKVGCNLRLKREFSFGETPLLAGVLAEQLMTLAGITETDLRRKAVATPAPVTAYPPASDPVKEMIRFRDRYPFLRDEGCPDVLKVMVADMFTAYDSYKKAHERLSALRSDSEAEAAYEDCKATVDSYLANRRIWAVLDYYKEHGELPPDMQDEESPDDEIARLSDLDLAGKLKSAVANESKHRKAVKAAQEKGEIDEKAESQLQYWSHRKAALREEIEKRKKK